MKLFRNSLEDVIYETLDKPVEQQVCFMALEGSVVGLFISMELFKQIRETYGIELKFV